MGFWGYDVVRGIEHLPDAPPDDRDLPDAVAMVVDTLLVLDNLFHLTEGRSLKTNIALVENNARLAAEIAVAMNG